jgi:hypothetical protein
VDSTPQFEFWYLGTESVHQEAEAVIMFYLTLPSNSSAQSFPNNTLTHYFTKLPHAIDLVGGQWEVGLAEIQYPHTWYNIAEDEAFFVAEIEGEVHFGVLKAGFYESPELLVKRLKLVCKSSLPDCNAIQFTYDNITKKVTVSLKPNVSISFSAHLQTMLGFAQSHYEDGIHEGDRVIDIRQGFYSLYVYCNILEPHMVGDVLVPLLRIVPTRGKDGELITRTYENTMYYPVQQKHFDTVELDIRDDTGGRVSFERGKVVVTLHFRERRSL